MWISVLLAVAGLALLVVTLLPGLRGSPGWRVLGFTAFFVFPALFAATTIHADLHHMKRVEFCGSCHVMDRHVQSLTYDDDEPLASVHYRNNYVSQETACYSCHVSYAMFGGTQAKVNGLHHVRAFLRDQKPRKIELYEPYSNSNCMHCHGTSERFRESETHAGETDFETRVNSGELSCLNAGCHDEAHYWDGKYDEGYGEESE
jgi:nitrate/TMAO reductase-like tetraheme cytochrome c subunit